MAKYYTKVYMGTGCTSPEAFQDVCFNNKNLNHENFNRLRKPYKLDKYLNLNEETGSIWWSAVGYLEGYQYISNSEMISKLSNFKPNNAPKAQPALKCIYKYYPKTPHQRLLLTETVKQLHAAGVELLWNSTDTDGVCFHLDYTFVTGVGVGWGLKGCFYDVDDSVVELSFEDMMVALVKLMPEPTKVKLTEWDVEIRQKETIFSNGCCGFVFSKEDMDKLTKAYSEFVK